MQTNWTAIISTSLTVLVGLACLILALTLGKNNPTAAGMLFATAGTALGSFLKQPQKAGTDSDSPSILPKGPIAILVFAALGFSSTVAVSCAHTTPTQFKDAVVTCTMENSSNAQAGAAVLGCLTGAVAGNYGACLDGLVTAGTWTITEVACIVRRLATESAQRLNEDKASGEDVILLDNANQWLRNNAIRFR